MPAPVKLAMRLVAAAVAAALLFAAPAAADNPRGRMLGAVPPAPDLAQAHRIAPAETADLLTYHGGPVVHDGHVYAVFWEPLGYSFPPGYKAAIAKYFRDVARDSGRRTNVYSVNREYPDRHGPPPYRVAFEASYTDTSFLPASACANPSTDVCLTDPQLASELAAFVVGKGLPRGLGRQYFLFTPPGVGSCFDGAESGCVYHDYCAYHSYADAAGVLLYAVHPYVNGVGTCDVGESPTGTSADAALNVVSHEHVEIITDPLGDAWYDSEGEENADKCAWRFGSLAGLEGALYNQVVGGSRYLLQLEWSNAKAGCVASIPNRRPLARYARSGRALAGSALLFDATRAKDPDGTIASYRWDFGDGTHARGRLATHAYTRGGTFRARLTVTDDEGATASRRRRVVVAKKVRQYRRYRRDR
ncbi:MAG TPA: PKD domain-containing protein [Thermoleophilaceae bacterium]|nr:PKD domain-containing protein [Thermoleophilaceae bacterium]